MSARMLKDLHSHFLADPRSDSLITLASATMSGTEPTCVHVSKSSQIISAINGRVGSDIFVPPYQQLFETEYLPPSDPHWTDECRPDGLEATAEDFTDDKILQPRRLSLRVF